MIIALLIVLSVWITLRLIASQSNLIAEDLKIGYSKFGLIGMVLCLPLILMGFVMAFIAQAWEELKDVIWI
jgi:prolipoprotein diacylglyceryltransferase